MSSDSTHLRAIHWWIRLFGTVWLCALLAGLSFGALVLYRSYQSSTKPTWTSSDWTTTTTAWTPTAYGSCLAHYPNETNPAGCANIPH